MKKKLFRELHEQMYEEPEVKIETTEEELKEKKKVVKKRKAKK